MEKLPKLTVELYDDPTVGERWHIMAGRKLMAICNDKISALFLAEGINLLMMLRSGRDPMNATANELKINIPEIMKKMKAKRKSLSQNEARVLLEQMMTPRMASEDEVEIKTQILSGLHHHEDGMTIDEIMTCLNRSNINPSRIRVLEILKDLIDGRWIAQHGHHYLMS